MPWNVRVWLECEQRMRFETEKIEQCVHLFAEQHDSLVRSGGLQKVLCQTNDLRWSEWCIFCYFTPLGREAEAVDAAPIQTSDIGKRWFSLVSSHFSTFGMPWRVRAPYDVYGIMVSAGQRAVESLCAEVGKFLHSAKIGSPVKAQCDAMLQLADGAILKHYAAISKGNHRRAQRELDAAVYHVHRLLYLAGENLDLVPRMVSVSS